MRRLAGILAGAGLVLSGGYVLAQEASQAVMGPPPVLVIQREFVKPGKGAAHEKSESAFVNAMRAAKWPTHYLAVESMSGQPRDLFMIGYPTFDAWEKDNRAFEKDSAFSAQVGKLASTDGDLLSGITQSVYVYDPDNSLHVEDVVHSRYFEISDYHVKPGHRAEFMELVKLYKDGYANLPNANWAMFDSYYGDGNGGLYIAISRLTSLSEDDAAMGDDKKFADAVGPEKMKQIRDLTAACLESSQTNLYSFNPAMSYPADEWIKADSFWKPKSAVPANKKPAPSQ